MPFNSSGDFAFNERMILAVATKGSGVYGIKNLSKWIYVGEAQDIENRLLAHVRGESDQSQCIFNYSPVHFVFEPIPGGALLRKGRERLLILELKPLCNLT
jgi:hypothetical protein